MRHSDPAAPAVPPDEPTLSGHPTGLFVLFFAEMWERFSYYGMRALLTFYMIKGFLNYSDGDAYAVYGAYTALVYLTPFFGGMLADRLLGQRRAVILGGVLMSAGHLTMTFQDETVFFVALALLVAGNGFFKPNISTMVGALYRVGDVRRDAGFTIFYMGINLGAALAPLLCGYIGESYGWHYGFGLATFGMLVGLSIFWAPTRVAQAFILGGAVLTAGSMIWVQRDQLWFMLALYGFMAGVLVVAAVFAFRALGRGGLPDRVGRPPDAAALHRAVWGIPAKWAVVVGTLLLVPVFAVLIAGSRAYRLLSDEFLQGFERGGPVGQVVGTILGEMSSPAGLILTLSGVVALVHLLREAFGMPKVARERMYVVLILTFFQLLFWSFFEQAGSSMANFTDRNVDRVFEQSVVEPADVGSTVEFRVALAPERGGTDLPPITQEQLGYRNGDGDPLTMTTLSELRALSFQNPNDASRQKVSWTVGEDNVGMGLGGAVIPASTFQAANPMFILLFGLVFTLLWGFLATRGWEPSTPLKFALGLLQLALGFGALWLGAQLADERGMVGMLWLLLGYLLHTTGELCLSPVGLSMITKLTPARLVSTAMGTWFLATAFSNFLAAVIAQFTGVGHGGDASATIPVPAETLGVYGGVFGKIAVAGFVCAACCFVLVPRLKRWTHEGVVEEE